MRLSLWLLLSLILGALILNTYATVKAEDVADGDDEGEEAAGSVPRPGSPGGAADDDDEGGEGEGEGENVAEEEEEELLKPSPDVITSVYFPDFIEKRIPVGEKVTMLVLFHNKGKGAFNITAIKAHLHSPFDYSYYIQNFTSREVGAVVQAGEEVSVEYVFMPDKNLEPLEFHLSAYLDYNDTEAHRFRTTFQNGTIELVERASTFDAKLVFSYFLAASAAGLIAFIGMNLSKSLTAPSKVERGTKATTSANADEWAGPIYKPKATSSAVGRKKAPKSPKSPGSAALARPARANNEPGPGAALSSLLHAPRPDSTDFACEPSAATGVCVNVKKTEDS